MSKALVNKEFLNTPNAVDMAYTPAGVGAIEMTIQDKFRESISIKDFGADPTGATDSSAALQAAIDAAQVIANSSTARGCVVDLGNGTYLINTQVTISENYVGLRGEGALNTVLFTTDTADASILKIEAASGVPIYGNRLEGIRFQGRGLTAAGKLVHFNNTQWGYFTNLRFDNGWDALYFEGGNYCFFDNLQITVNNRPSGVANTAVTLIGNATAGLCADIHFNNVNIWPQAGTNVTYEYAFYMSGIDGIYITNSHIQGPLNNTILLGPINSSGRDKCKSLMVSNTYFDSLDSLSTTGTHITFQGYTAAGEYEFFHFSNCFFRGSQDDSVRFSNLSEKPYYITFSGCQFRGNGNTAIKVDETTNPPQVVTVNGCIFSENNTLNAATNGDLLIRGKYWSITGCVFEGGTTNSTAIDLRTEADQCSVATCDFRASTAGVAKFRDTGTNNKRSLLYGVTLKNKGVSTITNPATTLVVSHGLATTPVLADFSLDYASSSANVTRAWVSNITSTQFTINLSATPTTTADIRWAVDTEN